MLGTTVLLVDSSLSPPMSSSLCRAVKNSQPPGNGLTVSVKEFSAAERRWIREAQQMLVRDKHFPMWTRQFGLYQNDDGLWQCGGRLEHANLPVGAKHPIILPRGHYVTELIVRRVHEKVLHNGGKETLTEV